jgi:hypothetical protein
MLAPAQPFNAQEGFQASGSSGHKNHNSSEEGTQQGFFTCIAPKRASGGHVKNLQSFAACRFGQPLLHLLVCTGLPGLEN